MVTKVLLVLLVVLISSRLEGNALCAQIIASGALEPRSVRVRKILDELEIYARTLRSESLGASYGDYGDVYLPLERAGRTYHTATLLKSGMVTTGSFLPTHSEFHGVFALDLPAPGIETPWSLLSSDERIQLTDILTGNFIEAKYDKEEVSVVETTMFELGTGKMLDDPAWADRYGAIHHAHILGPFFKSHMTAAASPLLLWLRSREKRPVGVCQDSNMSVVGILAMLGARTEDVEPMGGVAIDDEGYEEWHAWFRFRPSSAADWIERDATATLNPMEILRGRLQALQQGRDYILDLSSPRVSSSKPPTPVPGFLVAMRPPTIAEFRRARQNDNDADATSLPPHP